MPATRRALSPSRPVLSFQEAGRRSEEVFLLAFEHAPLAAALIALDGHYLHANRAMCELMGYSEEQLRALTVADLTHPDDVGADREHLRRLLAGEVTTATTEKRYVTATGTIVWASRSAWLVRRPDGTALHLVLQIQDISERREHERVLAEERGRLRAAQVIGGVGSWTSDLTTGITTWSDTLYELYGLDPDAFDLSRHTGLECIHPADRAQVDASLAKCIATGRDQTSYRVIRADGALRWFEGRVEAVYEDGRLVRVSGTVVDVTDLLAEADVRAAHAFQQAVIAASPDMILVYDVTVRSTVWTNRSVRDVLGYGSDETAGTGVIIENLIPGDDRPRWDAALASAVEARDDDLISVTLRLTHADGHVRWFSLRLTPFRRDDRGRVTQLVGVLHDTTDALAVEERLEHAALHDDLTGLPNRRLVSRRLARDLDPSQGEGQVVVLFCDLDGFKRVNDTHGHHAGDAVLVETAARMLEATRTGDIVGRMGGDEFVVVCAVPPGAEAAALADRVARRIELAVSRPVLTQGAEHRITVSVGICVGGRGDDAGAILRNSDEAMYLAKTRGKNGHATFELGLRAKVLDRESIERQIRRVLADDSLEVVYQPVVEPSSGRVRGVEALLRLPDGRGGHLDTLAAIQVAEYTGIVSALDQGVLRRACAQVAAWRRQPGHADLVLAVNRSAAEITRPGFYDRVRDVLTVTGLDPRALTIEITETVLLDVTDRTIADMRQLRAAGIGLAIDDFGTGYASLRYLAALPITCLKVDRSFAAGLPGDPICTTIVRATIGLADDLGMSCIVEGVETVDQLAALPDSPALCVQGYLYSRPLSPRAGLPTHLVAGRTEAASRRSL